MATDQSQPVIASDGSGGAIIAWQDRRHLSTETDVDIYAAHVLGDGSMDWTVGGVGVCLGAGVQRNPDIVADGAGGAIIAWMDARSDSSTGEDIYAQRLTAGGTAAWAPDGVAVVTATRDQAFPRVTSDGAEGAIVCWDDKRVADGDVNIFAQRLTSAGEVAAGWIPDGDTVCVATGNQIVPLIAPGDVGNAFIAWADARGPLPPSVYVQRMTADGEAGGTVGVSPALLSEVELAVTPNPSRSPVAVRLRLAKPARVAVTVHDIGGRRIRTLVPPQNHGTGQVGLEWDLKNSNGTSVAPGIYWVRAHVGATTLDRRVVVLE
jgi:hypothetical protein